MEKNFENSVLDNIDKSNDWSIDKKELKDFLLEDENKDLLSNELNELSDWDKDKLLEGLKLCLWWSNDSYILELIEKIDSNLENTKDVFSFIKNWESNKLLEYLDSISSNEQEVEKFIDELAEKIWSWNEYSEMMDKIDSMLIDMDEEINVLKSEIDWELPLELIKKENLYYWLVNIRDNEKEIAKSYIVNNKESI